MNMLTNNIVWKCMFSPKLYKIYSRGQNHQQYEMTGIERISDQIVNAINMLWNFGLYTSPIICMYLYRRNYFTPDGFSTIVKLSSGIGIIFLMSLYLRGWGRAHQPIYLQFLQVLETCQQRMTLENKRELQKYEFDFYAWPVEYVSEGPVSFRFDLLDDIQSKRGIITMPLQALAYIAIHTFGIRLIYPGSIGFIQSILGANLLQGRTRLIEVFNGQRYKLQTADNNTIDTMFVDNRHVTPRGNILFICSEGNAGFYEIGIMNSPIDSGYSVLGWNHPGFAGSTGKPYPPQEMAAVDVVVQFAINKLNFQPENIILYGWSIGGFTTTWAAMTYPNVRSVILDASFDDILPLAVQHMPKSLSSIVKIAIRDYANLNNIEFLKKYPGPILFIRRTEDEVICTEEQNLSTNRGNFLVKKLLQYRYPLIYQDDQITILNEYLALTGNEQDIYVAKIGNADDDCLALLKSYIMQHSKSYPMLIGNDMTKEMKNILAVYLVRKYLKDYKSNHCTPLPEEFLQQLWDINTS